MTGQSRPAPAELAALRELIQSAAGLIVDESRTDVLVNAVTRRMQASGEPTTADYLTRLTADAAELHELLELVVVRETYFARIPPQIEALRRIVLPDLIRRRAAERRLRIWSAGCSTGEEAWTLAMLLAPLLPAGWDAQVIGTDLSSQALQIAERGRYGARSVAQLDPVQLQRWFARDGDEYEIRAELRPLARFVRSNVVTDGSPLPDDEHADLIVCRNVTIYFDRATTRRAVDGFRAALAPDGWLMMGPSETLWRLHDGFEVVSLGEAFAYRRQSDPAPRREGHRPSTRGPAQPQLIWRAPMRPRAGSHPALRTGRAATPTTAAAVVEQPTAKAPATGPVSLEAGLEEIREQLLRGEYESARGAAQTLAEREPLSADAQYLHAVALVDLGRDRAALQPLRRAVYLAPGLPLPQFLLGTVLARLGHAEAAGGAFAAAEYALRGSADLDATVPELDGRPLRELAELCQQLRA